MKFSLLTRALAVVGCTVALVGASPGCTKDEKAAPTKGQKGAKGKRNAKQAGRKRGKPGPPPAAPPEVAKAKAAPALPELPELGAQAKADTPAKAPANESKCGDTQMTDGTVPLDCIEEGAIEGALQPLVPIEKVHVDDATLPTVVDHHADGLEGAVRDQGKAPLGSAFALAGAIDHAMAVWTGAPGKTSVMEIWSRYHAPSLTAALKVGPTFKAVGKPGAMYVPNYEGGKGAQSVLVAGYATFPHGTYFLVKNSAGEKWGDGGYAWIHEATVKANLAHAFVVDARPTDASKLKRKPHVEPKAGCPQGQFPDTATGACEGICPDKSPRYQNVCPKDGQCPKGMVNLTASASSRRRPPARTRR